MSAHSSSAARCRAAFTLIELLVVVAIIALLLSILLPSLEGARAQSRQLLCLTNLKAQGMAFNLYADDNEGFIGRGLMGFQIPGPVFNIYATTVIKYLGYNKDPLALWDVSSGISPSSIEQRRLRRALRQYGEQLQCPDYPDEAHDRAGERQTEPGGALIGSSLLDYVASAMPIPQTRANLEFDVAGGGQNGDGYQPEGGIPNYHGVTKLADIGHVANPARLMFVTEAHTSLQWDNFTYHHFFLTSQLPFGEFPRMASDQRHPGGITGLFFDGHAVVTQLHKQDPGWPNSIGVRLGLFTVVPDEYR